MYTKKIYTLTEEEYNYLFSIPTMRKHVFHEEGSYHLNITLDDSYSTLDCLKEFYNHQNELNTVIVYKCHKLGSIDPYRKIFNKDE